MKVAFRADGGGDGFGLGHLMRCISIAEEFRSKNIPVKFICRDYKPAIQLLQELGIEFNTIPNTTTLEEDQRLTLEHSADSNIVIIDGYTFTTEYLSYLKTNGKYVAFIDDLLDRNLPVNTVIAPSFNNKSDFTDKIAPDTMLLTGIEYLPLRHEFRELTNRETSKELRNVLLTFGGEDPHNVTTQVVKALNEYPTELNLHILIGSAYPFKAELDQLLKECKHTFQIHFNLKKVTQLFTKVDVAITAASTTIWELAASGVPMLLIQTADNQCRHCMLFQENDYGIVLGWRGAINATSINQALAKMDDPAVRTKYSSKGKFLVDGKGTLRIYDSLMTNYLVHNIQFRAVDQNPDSDDSITLWKWRNDPVTRRMSLTSDPIPWENHKDWYKKTVADQNRILLIAFVEDKLLGTIRFDVKAPHTAEVNININPEYRGKGVGKFVLKSGCEYGFNDLHYSILHAVVKNDNLPSMRIFESVGFKLQKQESDLSYFRFNKE